MKVVIANTTTRDYATTPKDIKSVWKLTALLHTSKVLEDTTDQDAQDTTIKDTMIILSTTTMILHSHPPT